VHRPNHGVSSVPAVAARQRDRGERVEVKIDNGLQSFGGRRALQRVSRASSQAALGGLQRD
jgi:hypothetical protein